jgi:DNA repair protein RadC
MEIMESTMTNQNWKIVSEIELIYKTKVKASERPRIVSSQSACNLVIQTWDTNKIEFIEQFKIILLNNGSKVLGLYEVSSGGITGTVVDLRLIFGAALKANATA